ncbi:MAG: Gfo/Idh/MocA family oxidoreductase [Chloroflexota bacterium]|nr:Gfo/Idh/MocA family oxidoreductase [Chloroflexota bacterium]
MRALVVGLGSIGRRHARNWVGLGLGELMVCRQAGRPLPQPLGFCAREFTDLAAALAHGPDVVLVTNPTSLHVATARQAIEAGAHVLVEKPLGHELAGVAELIAAADQSQRLLQVGYNLRFHPGLARLRELLHQGAVGEPLSVRAQAGEYLPDWHPWEDYRVSYAARRDQGGGAVLTLSHELDAVYWLFGAPTRVTAMTGRVGPLELDTEDVAEIILGYPRGMLASVHVDYLRRPKQRYLEVIGEQGVLRWEHEANRVLRYAPGTREWLVELGDPRFERNAMYVAELREFCARARGEEEVEGVGADGRQGAVVLSLALAALRSATTGASVELTAQESLSGGG